MFWAGKTKCLLSTQSPALTPWHHITRHVGVCYSLVSKKWRQDIRVHEHWLHVTLSEKSQEPVRYLSDWANEIPQWLKMPACIPVTWVQFLDAHIMWKEQTDLHMHTVAHLYTHTIALHDKKNSTTEIDGNFLKQIKSSYEKKELKPEVALWLQHWMFSRGPGFNSQCPHNGSQLSIIPVPVGPTPSFDLHGHQTHTWCIIVSRTHI